MTTTLTSRKHLAEEYISAWRGKDSEAMAKLLDPEAHLKSPLAEVTGREEFLEMVRKIMPMLNDVRIRAEFASESQAMIVYDFALVQPFGVIPTVNLMTFEDDRIRDVELFFDARPFEKQAAAK